VSDIESSVCRLGTLEQADQHVNIGMPSLIFTATQLSLASSTLALDEAEIEGVTSPLEVSN